MSDTYISQRAIINIPIPTKSERKYVTYNHDDIYEQGYQEALDKAATLPPADVVEVVRCKDCKHHAYDEIFSCYWCEYPGRERITTPDGFCEKGEE